MFLIMGSTREKAHGILQTEKIMKQGTFTHKIQLLISVITESLPHLCPFFLLCAFLTVYSFPDLTFNMLS